MKQSSPEELAFLAAYRADAFPSVALAVDVVALAVIEGQPQALVYQRQAHPDLGLYALPGGFVRATESLDEAAARLLQAKAGLSGVWMEQLYTFGAPDRDPRMRVVSVAYLALLPPSPLPSAARVLLRLDEQEQLQAQTPDGSPLAFDHAQILRAALLRLRGKVEYTRLAYQLLPPAFTLLQLQEVHEALLGRELNKDSFRRKVLMSGELKATGKRLEGTEHRPPMLYEEVKHS